MSALAPFAAIEAALAADTLRLLANAVATIAGREVAVIFDRAAVSLFGGEVASVGPQCTGLTEDLGALTEGEVVAIRGVQYQVVGQPHDDGAGMTVLDLRG